jgi:hypothetical protein
MKFSFKHAMALVVISSAFMLAATSCKKSNSSSNSGSMSASVNGTAWATSFSSTGIFSSAAGEFEIGGVQFKGGDSTIIAVAFFAPVSLNKTISSDTAQVDLGYVDTKTLAQYDGGSIAGHSVLTITSYDSTGHKIAGTFSGVVYNISGGTDSILITNGSFSSTFTAQ